jgi:NAD(P)-dependent dehydrogenase (short-subunit alcohol dehydrogenase family)
VGRPQDIADVIAYLASDDAAFVQGAMVRADGGRLDRL